MSDFSTPEWIGISLVIMIMGMSKGGLPIAGVALPLLVLLWPEKGQAARSAVSFMLPLLCAMDLVGVLLYRGKPDWSHIKKLLPPTVAGIIAASLFFVSDKGISVSDQMSKLVVGILGLSFTGWHYWGRKFFLSAQSNVANDVNRARILGFFWWIHFNHRPCLGARSADVFSQDRTCQNPIRRNHDLFLSFSQRHQTDPVHAARPFLQGAADR